MGFLSETNSICCIIYFASNEKDKNSQQGSDNFFSNSRRSFGELNGLEKKDKFCFLFLLEGLCFLNQLANLKKGLNDLKTF